MPVDTEAAPDTAALGRWPDADRGPGDGYQAVLELLTGGSQAGKAHSPVADAMGPMVPELTGTAAELAIRCANEQ